MYKPLMYNKTNINYRNKVKNPLLDNKTNVHYRIRGKDALVRASMGELTPLQHRGTIVITWAR